MTWVAAVLIAFGAIGLIGFAVNGPWTDTLGLLLAGAQATMVSVGVAILVLAR